MIINNIIVQHNYEYISTISTPIILPVQLLVLLFILLSPFYINKAAVVLP